MVDLSMHALINKCRGKNKFEVLDELKKTKLWAEGLIHKPSFLKQERIDSSELSTLADKCRSLEFYIMNRTHIDENLEKEFKEILDAIM